MKEALLAAFKVLGIKPPAGPTVNSLLAKLSDETGMQEEHLEKIFSRPGINIELLSSVTVRRAREEDAMKLSKHVLYNFIYRKPTITPTEFDIKALKANFLKHINNKPFKYADEMGSLVIEEKKMGLGVLGHLNFYDYTVDTVSTHRMFQGSPEKETRNMLGKLLVLKAMQLMKPKHDRVVASQLTPYGEKLFESMGFKEATREDRAIHPNPQLREKKMRKYVFKK